EIALMASYAPVPEPLPVDYYIGLAYGRVHPGWLRRVLLHRPDPDVAAWLVTLDEEHRTVDADTLGRWLAFGLPRGDTLVMVESGVSPDLPFKIAWATDWSVHAAARSLVIWTRVGCLPQLEHFEVLAEHRILDARVSRESVDQLCGEVRRLVGRAAWERGA